MSAKEGQPSAVVEIVIGAATVRVPQSADEATLRLVLAVVEGDWTGRIVSRVSIVSVPCGCIPRRTGSHPSWHANPALFSVRVTTDEMVREYWLGFGEDMTWQTH